MKLSTVLIAAVAGSAAAFSAPKTTFSPARTTSARFMSEEEAEVEVEVAEPEPEPVAVGCVSKEEILSSPNTLEFGSVWDPLGLSKVGSAETLAWYRHAEVKHGRVAMAAFAGWCAVGAGLRFPGELADGLKFADLPSKGLDAWDAVPGWGKAQILLFIGLIELHDEIFFKFRDTHYLRGGTPGKVRATCCVCFWTRDAVFVCVGTLCLK